MRRIAVIGLLAGLLAGNPLQASAQALPGTCPWRMFPDFVPCDRAGAVLCTAGFGLYRFDGTHGPIEDACDARRTSGAAVFRLLAARGVRDPNSPVAQGFSRAIGMMLAHKADPSVDFWALAYNPTDKPATASLEVLIGLLTSRVGEIRQSDPTRPQWDPPRENVFWQVNDYKAYWQPDSYLMQQISLGNDYGMQPGKRWRQVNIALKPGEVAAVPVRLLRRANKDADGPRTAGLYPIGLFRETALDHYSIDESDVLSLGVAPIEASPGWGPSRSHW